MAQYSPRTWTTGDTITAAELNALEQAAAAALTSADNLSDVASAATARTNLGLGTAATQPTSAFDAAGAASTMQAYAVQRANHTGTQPASTVTGLATVATTGAYTDLTGTPTIPAAVVDNGDGTATA